MADWVARDPEAGVLVDELRCIAGAMAKNEMSLPMPESREFYWSKIERQIQRESIAPSRTPVSWIARWRQLLIPLTGATAMVFVLTMAVIQLHRPTFDEISATGQGMEAVTFHDQSAGMTVVWLQDSTPASETAQPAKTSAPADANSDVETE
jgi:hypothetical protein